MTLRIGILADFHPGSPPLTTLEPALSHAAAAGGIEFGARWIATDSILDMAGSGELRQYHGLWAGPGSPYRSLDGMLEGIRFARVAGIPFLGTCGGCQHAILEFARNVLHFDDATSAEYDPYASHLFVSALVCSLVGKRML